MLTALFFEVHFAHILGVAVLRDVELLGDLEVLGLLLSDVIDITGQANSDIAEVGWNLKV